MNTFSGFFTKKLSSSEIQKILLGHILFFLFMMSYYILKPVGSSLYIHYVGAKHLPEVYFLSVFVSYFAMALYEKIYRARGAKTVLQTGVLFAFVSCLGLWILQWSHLLSPKVCSLLFFLVVSLFGVCSSTWFWTLSNDIFKIQEAKQFYSWLGLGGILGAATGAKLTQWLVKSLQTETLLIVGALSLIPVWALLRLIQESYQNSRKGEKPLSFPKGLAIIFKYPKVRVIAFLVFLMTLTGTLFNFHYNDVVNQLIEDKEEKTRFLAGLFAEVNLYAFFIQTFLTGTILLRFGPLPGLLLLPSLSAVGAIFLLKQSNLAVVAFFWTMGLALTYSLHQASKEVLYIPNQEAVKYSAKGYIDVFFFRLGDSLAAVFGFFWISIFHLPTQKMLFLALPLIPLWLYCVSQVRIHYPKSVLKLKDS